MAVEQFILTYWPQLMVLGGLIVWGVRVEAMVKQVVKDIVEMKERRKEDLTATQASLEEVHETLIEIQRDIKNILSAIGGKR